MAGVRDPAFWKRFSVAVHLDEERGPEDLKSSDSWLARQQAKKARRTWICWTFWLCVFGFIAAIVAVIIWMLSTGMLNDNSTPSSSKSGTGSGTGSGSGGNSDTGGAY